MTIVQINSARQITLPEEIVRKAGIGAGDWLEVGYENDAIVIQPKAKNPQSRKTRKTRNNRSMMEFFGAARGAFGETEEEVRTYLSNERAAWRR